MKQEFRFLECDLSYQAVETQTDLLKRLAKLVRENDIELVLVRLDRSLQPELITAWTADGILTPIIVYPGEPTGLEDRPIGPVHVLYPGETLLLEDQDLLIHGGLLLDHVIPPVSDRQLAMLHNNYRNFLIAPPTETEPCATFGFDHCFSAGSASSSALIGSVMAEGINLQPLNLIAGSIRV